VDNPDEERYERKNQSTDYGESDPIRSHPLWESGVVAVLGPSNGIPFRPVLAHVKRLPPGHCQLDAVGTGDLALTGHHPASEI